MASLRISARPLLATLRHVPRACRPAPIGARTFSTSFAKWAVVKDGPPVTQTNRAEHTLRRFWKTVNISSTLSDGFLINLDHRALKTPFGAKLEIPKERRLLAALIANEWENQDEVLKQHALPVTSLASRAIDGLSEGPTRPAVIEALLKYLETDTILYPDDAPAPLVRLQKEHWDPLRAWLKEDFGVELQLAQGFGAVKQTDDNVEKLKKVVEGMDGWELAAFERAVYATKSFVIALALCRGRLTAHEAAQASHVEVSSQIERWGEVEDTHDVDYQDIRRALGSAACLLIKS
ncbi:ATP synthase mitochondrial F1 complex assembly factor 2 [Cryptococcus deuterogattii R265]|uniref:ATP synthase mitochondrial F1 complex assembly factor 2 n=1 Tax=Cryptococcus deuterogattii (strain R265) TaxID=294750 RepID=A0A095CDA7_CRYD2|nr:ATP synthase mitochondrial F1 complex assembly factor 2 [Cryptococcus deuterogattii R265]KIR37081.1 ATP synthase mitochondrial F1 complex assembly factor 2 [Cryptococcus deuterogattii MMRL2647]KIR74885.1 ATP synthase mitochondrial F1 complex assembly factor 2 [Cryptococcus deuterogattii CA1014]KIS01354.1 ATP synthase mitochondrial F1 complex assembly factor 2 [Cryptococcus deuterogattii 2001/935-1]